MKITTHILDTTVGKPAAAVKVELFRLSGGGVELLADRCTDKDGRIVDFFSTETDMDDALMKMIFHTGEYFGAENSFYPFVEIFFIIGDLQHYHIPLLISPYSYTTYRGS